MRLETIIDHLQVALRLGVRYSFAVLVHHRRRQRGYFESKFPAQDILSPRPFWSGSPIGAAPTISPTLRSAILTRGDDICRGEFLQFSHKRITEGAKPAWFKGSYATNATQHFSRVPINEKPGDDVRLTWDLSRMRWATELALAASVADVNARTIYLDRLQQLTTDWLQQNGYHRGANWACASEVSLRGLQLMLTTLVLQQHVGLRPTAQLLELIETSWKRVYNTRAYGRAQQNTQSLAEYIFLTYGAAFLGHYEAPVADADTYRTLRHEFTPLLRRLILEDGGTAMYSTNDHRACCDLLAIGKIFDDLYNVEVFVQSRLQQKITRLAAFMAAIIEPISGQAPLIGHNDGARHCPQYSPFAQFEPSLLLLSAVFQLPVSPRLTRAADATWLFNYTAHFTAAENTRTEQQFDEFGLLIHTRDAYRAYVKYPRNRFRPPQHDFLHLDLWIGGENLLSDSGTFSDNPAITTREGGLNEAQAHNAPQRLHNDLLQQKSPLHYGYWPNALVRHPAPDIWNFTVSNGTGMLLHRRIMFEPRRIVLRDKVIDTQPWGTVLNGKLQEGRGNMTMMLDQRAKITFLNVQHFALSDSVRADNYQSVQPSYRMLAEPALTMRPITTTIELT